MNSKEINFFAKTNFRNKEQIFGIKTDDRRRHMYVIGKTGMGKTSLIQNMAIQDIRNGKGVAIVDPHGEFAEECLKAVPSNRINDVIYFNPSDTDFPIAMNVMEQVDAEYRPLVASGLVGVFKKIWADSWGPRLEYLLRNAILALLEYPSSTLLGVTRILVDKDFREKVLESVTDPVVKAFWTNEFTKYQDRLLSEAIAPIQNKVGQFLSNALIRNIVGQVKSSFSVREIMDGQKILIMNLSKGRIGEDSSALLGAMMITKIQLAAMSRVDIPESERKDFYLYVDEFQNFATESFANILSEARKYRLNLILAHQYVAQLDEKVRDAVFGNVGTIVTFRVGAMDAEFLEQEFQPTFFANDLVNLAKYNTYLKLMIDGVATNPFSASTLMPISLEETEVNVEKIIRATRERYGNKRDVVEDKISRWSGVIKPEAQNRIKQLVKARIAESADAPRVIAKSAMIVKKEPRKTLPVAAPEAINNKPLEKVEKKEAEAEIIKNEEIEKQSEAKLEKVLYKDKCWACGIDIEIPFKPDGQRPTFCKDCMKDYRRQQSILQNQLKEAENKGGGRNMAMAISLKEALGRKPQQFSGSSKENDNKKKEPVSGEIKELINKALEEGSVEAKKDTDEQQG